MLMLIYSLRAFLRRLVTSMMDRRSTNPGLSLGSTIPLRLVLATTMERRLSSALSLRVRLTLALLLVLAMALQVLSTTLATVTETTLCLTPCRPRLHRSLVSLLHQWRSLRYLCAPSFSRMSLPTMARPRGALAWTVVLQAIFSNSF